MDRSLQRKQGALEMRLEAAGPVAIAYSGGVDSTFLLSVAAEVLGDSVLALRALTPAQPDNPRADPREFCLQRDIALEEFPLGEEGIPGFMENPAERCYLCKRHLFEKAWGMARQRGLERLCDGSNADDCLEHRPGRRALEELQVATPLADCGLTKADVRELSRQRGLPTADQPAAACLYTRFPTGCPLQPERLEAIAAAEALLAQEGFADGRVRIEGSGARIEVRRDQVPRLASEEVSGPLREALQALGFTAVAIDPRGYRLGGAGSLADPDEAQPQPQ